MKVAVTSTGPTLDDQVESRFGRCPYFLIVDTDSMQFEAVENPNIALGGGAGILSAQMMAEKGVSHILTGNCGPNAFRVFGQAGVKVAVGVTGSAREAVERFKAGEFDSAGSANVQSHYGMKAGGQLGQASDADLNHPLVRVPQMGMGRCGGMGKGRGGSRGMGWGKGMGGGGGMGFGMGWNSWIGPQGFASMHAQGESYPINPTVPVLEEEPSDGLIRQEPHEDARNSASGMGRKAAAWVQSQSCARCGICMDVCPVGAIRMERHAVVNPALCTACAACVSECPNEAIIIIQQRVLL